MNYVLQVILGYQVNVGVIEIVVFLVAGLVLGFFIHFFMVSRNSMRITLPQPPPMPDTLTYHHQLDEWRLKYQEEMEVQEKIQMQLRRQIDEAKENEELLTIEIEELHKEIDRLREEPPPQPVQTVQPVVHITSQEVQSEEYLHRLQKAQEGLTEQNQNIARLLDQIELLKQTEFRHIDTMKANEELTAKLNEAQKLLAAKDNQILQLQQQQLLADEMEERLQKVYEEFNALREKLSKVENLTQPQNRQFEYDELQQSHLKLSREFDEAKQKHMGLLEENQRLSRLLTDTEEKLRESNFQRQQLQKKITFLEELNHELQQISEHNKKLESQLRRMSEIETMLARVAGKKPGKEGNTGNTGNTGKTEAPE